MNLGALTFLDATEFCNGDAELLADARVGADARHDAAAGSDRPGREADASTLGKALNKHVPSEPAPLLPPEDARHGDPDILPLDRAIHEGGVQRHVAGTHPETGMIALQKGNGETIPTYALQQVVRVGQVLRLEPHKTK